MGRSPRGSSLGGHEASRVTYWVIFFGKTIKNVPRAHLFFSFIFGSLWIGHCDLPRPAGANHVHEDDERGYKGKKGGGIGLPWESAALIALIWEMPTEHQRRLGSQVEGLLCGKFALDTCLKVVMASSLLFHDHGELF